MKTFKKSFIIIGLGVLNILHASLHIFQFVQSFMLVKASIELQDTPTNHSGLFSDLLHSPYFTIVWALVGILTLYIGIKDFIHHKKCKNG
jgi:predicted membrane protein